MRIVNFARAGAAAALAAVLITSAPKPAEAGFFDLFSSSPDQDSSGREFVVFRIKADPGSIVVSFADRKLYYVLPNYRAISYPIGAPMGEARWEGVLKVSEKRINPMWTPTADMRRENPRCRLMSQAVIRSIRWDHAPCISAIRPTAFTAPTRRGPSARTSPMAASACTITT